MGFKLEVTIPIPNEHTNHKRLISKSLFKSFVSCSLKKPATVSKKKAKGIKKSGRIKFRLSILDNGKKVPIDNKNNAIEPILIKALERTTPIKTIAKEAMLSL